MDFIYCQVEPFLDKSKLEIHKSDNNQIQYEYFDFESLPKVILDKSNKTNINNVIISCSAGRGFVDAAVESLKNLELQTYSTNKLEIEVIEK